MLNKKDLIRVNQEIGEDGGLQNESSLDFAISQIKRRKSWLFELSYITRALLVDHTFIDGNKRTALAIIITYFEQKEIEYDRQEVAFIVYKIAKKGVKDINRIMRLIKSGIIY